MKNITTPRTLADCSFSVGYSSASYSNDAAACVAAATSGVIASMPSGEQAIAATPIIAALMRLSDGAKCGAGVSKYIVLMTRR